MDPKQDESDEESCADRPEMCWLDEAFKGDWWMCLHSFRSKHFEGIHGTWHSLAGTGDPISLSFTPHVVQVRLRQTECLGWCPLKRHPIWINNIHILQGRFLEGEEYFGFLETFANNKATLTPYYLWSVSWMLAFRCRLLPCLFTSESCGSLHGTIYSLSSGHLLAIKVS